VTITGTATAPVISVSAASTSASGIVQLNDTLASTSTTTALTAAQGKALQTQIDALVVSNNLTLAGTLDSSTGFMATVTAEGTLAGFTVGAVIPNASATTNEKFVIVTVASGAYTPPGGAATATTVGSWFLSSTSAWSYLGIGPAQYWSSTGSALSPATVGNTVAFSAGTAALPGITLVGNTNTGIYQPATNQVGMALNGSNALTLTTAGLFVPAGISGGTF
jgi:hypothetical protein